ERATLSLRPARGRVGRRLAVLRLATMAIANEDSLRNVDGDRRAVERLGELNVWPSGFLQDGLEAVPVEGHVEGALALDAQLRLIGEAGERADPEPGELAGLVRTRNGLRFPWVQGDDEVVGKQFADHLAGFAAVAPREEFGIDGDH